MTFPFPRMLGSLLGSAWQRNGKLVYWDWTVPMASIASHLRTDAGAGLAAGFGAFFIWGMLALYWHPLAGIPATEILAHRIFWSLVTITPFVWLTGRLPEIRAALAAPHTMLRIACSASIIGVNWCIYIWAITHNRVIEASLGYYINPLVNVLLGRVLLGERMARPQALAVGLAAVGVLWSVAAYGSFPWVAVTLALTFALYGFFRKTVAVESAPGLFLEALLLAPLAAGWLLWLHTQGQSHFGEATLGIKLLLLGTGLVTSIPLMLFAYAARHMSLSTLGLLQYVAPTGTFLLGVYVFNEPVTSSSLVTFGCIWCALALYSWCSLRLQRIRP